MTDGFWGALIGALITGVAGISVILIQFNQEKERVRQQSKKEIKHFVYFAEKFLESISEIIAYKNKMRLNRDKIDGYTTDVDDNDQPISRAVSFEKGETKELLEHNNYNIRTYYLPKEIKRCQEAIIKLDEIDLNLIEYQIFEKVLNSFYLIESTNEEVNAYSILELQRVNEELKESILRLKSYLD